MLASWFRSVPTEATLLGEGSYVDLLTCMQMSDPAKLTPAMDLKGASKNRNKN
jgi:hypothetical protein